MGRESVPHAAVGRAVHCRLHAARCMLHGVRSKHSACYRCAYRPAVTFGACAVRSLWRLPETSAASKLAGNARLPARLPGQPLSDRPVRRCRLRGGGSAARSRAKAPRAAGRAHTTSRSPITSAITTLESTLESALSALSSIRSLSTCRPVRPRPLSHAANRPTLELADAPLMLRRVRFRRSLGHKRLSPEQLALVPHAPVPTAAQLLQVRTHFTWPRAAQHAACGAHHA